MKLQSDPYFYKPPIKLESRDQDSLILCSSMPLKPHKQNVNYWLEYWAKKTPAKVFLAQKIEGEDSWDFITYANMYQTVQHIASALIDLGLAVGDKVILLSGNSINNAMMQLACTLIGISYIPLSPSYSLIPQAREKLSRIFTQIAPNLVFAESGVEYSEAFSLLSKSKTLIATAREPVNKSIDFNEFKEHTLHQKLEDYKKLVTPETIIKILMTSGSTGFPKGVPNTHRMICTNQQSLVQVWPFLAKNPPVLVDWLPWHHTFGGNHNFYMVMRNGGSLYIDEGKPTPEKFHISLESLQGVSPTIYLNVPYGHENMVLALEGNKTFSKHFFQKLQGIFTAASALPEETWQRWKALCKAHCSDAFISSAWGCTETSPLVTNVHFLAPESNNIGLPLPGWELKLKRHVNLYELCVRGPGTFKGYLGETSQNQFDEDGYFHTGDLCRLIDPNDIQKGLRFEGRLTENFKLANGNWVQVNDLRVKIIGASKGLLQDVVVAGEHRPEIGLIMVLNLTRCRQILSCPKANELELASSKHLCDMLVRIIHRYNQINKAQTQQIRRVTCLTEPLDISKNEITDKGYINQRAVLRQSERYLYQGCTKPHQTHQLFGIRRSRSYIMNPIGVQWKNPRK